MGIAGLYLSDMQQITTADGYCMAYAFSVIAA